VIHRPIVHRLGLSVVAVAALAAAPAFAHHSFNAYDMSKIETVSGAIKEFRWGAPHSSVVLVSVDKGGQQQTMSLISGSPLAFSKQGFAPRDFHRGDKVTATYPTARPTRTPKSAPPRRLPMRLLLPVLQASKRNTASA
jgi:hypothetical protein